ncbi:MAG: hypothetical protein JNK47_16810 [Mesorhizobium sp.]|nr:hypothetical protein [Mesorhizobium sp.]MBL8578886.1 hypothetical protein [Mesorhizobium sp.]
MAGMNPERKTQNDIEKANRKMLEEQDKRLKEWRENRINSIDRDRKEASSQHLRSMSLR